VSLTFQAKRYFRETGKDKQKKESEVTDIKNPVFAGQIFAEMLAGICHPEYYKYSDQEVIYMYLDLLFIIIGVRDPCETYFISVVSRFF
jgi:hypothetical protein